MLLGAAAGALLCGGVVAAGALLTPHTADPELTARAVCADLVTRNYDSLYDVLSPRLQATGTRAQFVASQRQLDLVRGATTACSAVITSASSGSADATLALRRGAAATQMASMRLIVSANAWRVDAYDSTLVRASNASGASIG